MEPPRTCGFRSSSADSERPSGRGRCEGLLFHVKRRAMESATFLAAGGSWLRCSACSVFPASVPCSTGSNVGGRVVGGHSAVGWRVRWGGVRCGGVRGRFRRRLGAPVPLGRCRVADVGWPMSGGRCRVADVGWPMSAPWSVPSGSVPRVRCPAVGRRPPGGFAAAGASPSGSMPGGWRSPISLGRCPAPLPTRCSAPVLLPCPVVPRIRCSVVGVGPLGGARRPVPALIPRRLVAGGWWPDVPWPMRGAATSPVSDARRRPGRCQWYFVSGARWASAPVSVPGGRCPASDGRAWC